MTEFSSIEDLATDIKSKLDITQTKKKVMTLYAFNSTGKTRLSNLLNGMSEDRVSLGNENGETIVDTEGDEIVFKSGNITTLCYNAFFEDMFTWNNNKFILHFYTNSRIIKLIEDEGLETNIINNFKDIINANDVKIEPSFNWKEGEVSFIIASGDNVSTDNIKISKGEESMLIWSVFYTVLEAAIDALNSSEEDRTIGIFNELQYIIIDDPVSSIDDTKIITMAIKLIDTIKKYQGNKVKYMITTHHALFYNILVNSFNRNSEVNFKSYSLYRNNNIYRLTEQGDSPFSYHLSVKELIKKAINEDTLEKYHFNLFRALLEKTANFLGYNNRYDCIRGDNKQEATRLLNLYSHSKLSDIESNELSTRDKIVFQETFDTFISTFNWN